VCEGSVGLFSDYRLAYPKVSNIQANGGDRW
jgi:hypothetical protein